MTTVENNTFTGPNTGISGGYVPSTTIESTSMDSDLNRVKDDLDYHLSILQAIYTKLDTVEINAAADATASEIVLDINASVELIDADNLEATVALLSNIISDIEAHKITTTQSAMHPENSIKSTEQTYSYTPSSIVTSCQNVLDEINNVRIQIHKILGQSTWIDTPDTTITAIKTKLDTIESNATGDQSASEIRTLVESATDSNVFTNADHSKLNGIANNANAYVHPNHSGDVTSVADGVQTIGNDKVTYSKMQNVVNDERILGRVSGPNGNVQELTKTQVLSMINVQNGATDNQSASEILTAIKTVDGTSSGLDADLLDGSHKTDFLLRAPDYDSGCFSIAAASASVNKTHGLNTDYLHVILTTGTQVGVPDDGCIKDGSTYYILNANVSVSRVDANTIKIYNQAYAYSRWYRVFVWRIDV